MRIFFLPLLLIPLLAACGEQGPVASMPRAGGQHAARAITSGRAFIGSRGPAPPACARAGGA